MRKLELIAALGRQGQLGLNGKLPWHLPSDLRHFKKVTQGCVLVMGRKTFSSLPGLLPGRHHLVLSRQHHLFEPTPFLKQVSNIDSLAKILENNYQHLPVFVIGGAEIYVALMPYVDRAIITHVDAEVPADTYFPLSLLEQFTCQTTWPITADLQDEHSYRIISYNR